MSKVSLNSVRYYDITDIYTASVDNRPLRDIADNIDLLNAAIQHSGIYHELYASEDLEPAGGFSPYTCVAVSSSNRLIPIDISASSLVIDYTALPIYLVIEALGSSLYKCVSFSASISIPTALNSFLAESINKALKVGPGGSLVDEIYFDIHYGALQYQQITVGKVLTKSAFSFGGNQVNTLGDNRFLARNRNDSTTGLVTKLIDVQDSNVAFSSVILPDSVVLSETKNLFTSFISSVGGATPVSPSTPSDIYFSYRPLVTDKTTGKFLSNVSTLLNSVHFAPITISPLVDTSLTTAGVNVASLLDFSSAYTLHSQAYSSVLSETSQTLGTSLTVSNQKDINFEPYSVAPPTQALDSIFLLDPDILSNLQNTTLPGVTFGNYLQTSTNPSLGGAFIGFVQDNGDFGDPSPWTFDENGPTDISNCNNLILYSKKQEGNIALGSASLYLLSDGFLVLGAPNGVFYKNTPVLNYEITNKGYVDSSILAISDAAKLKVPYTGTTQETPITGSLVFNTTASTTPDVNLVFTNLVASQFRSNTKYEFRDLVGSAFQSVLGKTLPDNDPSASNDDLTTRSYVTTAISALSGAALSGYVSKDTSDTIRSTKTFTVDGSHPTAGIVLNVGTSLFIKSEDAIKAGAISIKVPDGKTYFTARTESGSLVKFASAATLSNDSSDTVVTKGYLDSAITTEISDSFNDAALYAMWGDVSLVTNVSNNFAGYQNWRALTQGAWVDSSTNFFTLFTQNADGSLTYNGTKKGLFMVTASDARTTDKGPAFSGGVWRSQLAILAKRTGTGSIVKYAYNIHQDDTEANSVNSLVATSCSSMVTLSAGDTLAVLTEWAQTGSCSIALLRYV